MPKTLDEILKKKGSGTPKKFAAVWAGESHILEAALDARKKYDVEPVLIGDTKEISRILAELGCQDSLEMVEADSPESAIQAAIEMIKNGQVDIIFKGLMETAVVMKAVVNKETGICRSGVLSHASLVQIPGHHKLVAVTDSALLTYPTKEQKVELIRNAVRMLQAIGVAEPKVAILAAVETVNPKMPETVEADELKTMWKEGVFHSCQVEGPISYDLAMDEDAAAIKGYKSPVAGQADILVVPNIQAGNILIKSLIFSAKAKSCGLIIGAAAPIIIPTRSAPVENKSTAIGIAAALGNI